MRNEQHVKFWKYWNSSCKKCLKEYSLLDPGDFNFTCFFGKSLSLSFLICRNEGIKRKCSLISLQFPKSLRCHFCSHLPNFVMRFKLKRGIFKILFSDWKNICSIYLQNITEPRVSCKTPRISTTSKIAPINILVNMINLFF